MDTDGLCGGRGSYCSIIVDVTGSNLNPVFFAPPLSCTPDREGAGAPAQQAVRDPQRSVPGPNHEGEAHSLLTRVGSLCPVRQVDLSPFTR